VAPAFIPDDLRLQSTTTGALDIAAENQHVII
jgi:hypothetical protein